MKRGREEEEEQEEQETCWTEAGSSQSRRPPRRGGGLDGSPPKRKRWYVVKYVQKLLTNYFITPRGLPKPSPAKQLQEEEGDADEELPDAETDSGGPVMLSCR